MKLYTHQQVYRLDQLCMTEDGQSSEQLMFKAATAVWRNILLRWPDVEKLLILAGSGNNGGDAFAIAGIAVKAGIKVDLYAKGNLDHQSQAAKYFRKEFEATGGKTKPCTDNILVDHEYDLIVDGLLGIGLNQELNEEWQSLIHSLNRYSAPKVCIDIPSGLNADTGNPMPCAVSADMTVSFIGRKIGCFLAHGKDYCGDLKFDALGISSRVLNQVEASADILTTQNTHPPLKRANNSYKNQFGHVLVVGGDKSLGGATRLAGMAALRTGCGLVSVCVHPENYPIVASSQPELMVSDWDQLDQMLEKASVMVIGPGLGQSDSAKVLLNRLAQVELPMVIDADGLMPEFLDSVQSQQVVITPHPGEAARLLSKSTESIQLNRLESLHELTDLWPFVSVLKGSGSLIGLSNEMVSLCDNGNAGMATAGMGDVLAGMIASYLGQGLEPLEAARTAVLVHALAAEHYACAANANSLIASDVIENIAHVLKAYEY